MSAISEFITGLYHNRKSILVMSNRNLRQQYFGSALGWFWAFIEPLLFMGILYAVFTAGFRAGKSSDMPFSIYLIMGMTAWLYFAKTLSGSVKVIEQHSYLTHNPGFCNKHIPLINIIGNLVPHLFFIILAIALAWSQGFPPTLYSLQIIYYIFCMSALLLAMSWVVASTQLFVKDVARIVSLVIQFGFWLTPIFWNISMIPEKYHWAIKVNPVFYVVRGYRESLVQGVGFWEHPLGAFYFWLMVIVLLYVGSVVFNKLEPHFGDVV